jgi:hypothetical protein
MALLPVSYFHLVFTAPGFLAPFALQNKRLFYDLLFRLPSEQHHHDKWQTGVDLTTQALMTGFLAAAFWKSAAMRWISRISPAKRARSCRR